MCLLQFIDRFQVVLLGLLGFILFMVADILYINHFVYTHTHIHTHAVCFANILFHSVVGSNKCWLFLWPGRLLLL
ncbi:mCG1030031 [Mus musculus]|nr:mCG1030031 [Mus musculus]